ncbi:MAG: hypoxanthine-guanine phosphoribosyltransferase [Trichlorobacter sp.]|nr:hypoxanthine-guanine phosphoribosyltransferase [Trichlorobacter sp.]
MDYVEALRILEEADCLADQQTITKAIARMADEITAKIGKQNPLVYCIMNGGLIFTGQLLPLLHFPLEVGYLHASRYGKDHIGNQLEWIVPPQTSLTGRTVLLLDDILDEGVTLKAITEACQKKGARQVLTAVLVEKKHNRKVKADYHADFTGLQVEDRFVFGFGLDYDLVWRNAPGIYAVKGL